MNCKDAKLETKYLPSDLSDKLRHSAGIPAEKFCKMVVTLFFLEEENVVLLFILDPVHRMT